MRGATELLRGCDMPMRLTLTFLLVIAASSLGMGQGYNGAASSPDTGLGQLWQPPPFAAKPCTFLQPGPAGEDENAEPESPFDLFDLGTMAGGAAGTGSALPTLQGDTTWGGRPAFPHVIAPALILDNVNGIPPYGLPIYNNGTDRLIFSANVPPNFIVDSNSLPASLKSADLVLGTMGLQLGLHTFLPFSAMLLSSPIIGYDMINWAENGSVVPQDRVFFDYRHFDAVGSVEIVSLNGPDPLHGHPNPYFSQQEFFSLPVDRYVLGFEKTFFGGQWSVEARIPLQGQTASTQTFVPGLPLENELELGNVGVAIKGYVLNGSNWKITEGVGVQLPTSPATDFTYKTHFTLNWNILSADLHETLEIKQSNETVWVNPFIGIAYDSQRRCFAQGIFQLCVPLNRSSASLATSVTSGNISSGSNVLFDFTTFPLSQTTNIPMAFAPLFRANMDFGYRLYQNPQGRVNSVAAILEIDDTNAVGGAYTSNVVDLGPQLVANVGNTELAAGLLVPVSTDQAYKWEFTFRLNRRF